MPHAFPPDKPTCRRTRWRPAGHLVRLLEAARRPFDDASIEVTLLKLNVVMKEMLGMIREHRAAYSDEAMISKLGVNPVRTLTDR